MAKRIATNELNDRNWDQEEEEEEAGKFVPANSNILQKRTIIKAKRRTLNTSTSSGTGLFSSFAGFGSASSSGNSTTVGFPALPSKPILFGAGSSSGGPTTTSANVSSTDSKSAEMQSTASAVSTTTSSSSSSSSNNGIKSTTTTTGADKNSENQDPEFLSNLKKLNESVLKWIEQHVADNPFCILTPIFKDYDDHLNKIRKSKSDGNNVENSELSAPESNLHKNGSSLTTPSSSDTATVTTSADSSITTPASETKITNSAAPTTTSSTSNPWSISSVPNSIFSSTTTKTPLAGTQPSSIFGGTGFSFKPSDTKSAFSFDPSAVKSAPAAEEEEEYEPPKPENKEIKEEGAVYTKRCKLFYEKDKNWIDKGVGNLHVKPLKDKAQLIIRADTNLGNILLNIMLLPSMQLKRQGKNNVSLVCIPNPPVSKDSDNKLIPMLLRVKTAEEADELLEELNKHKNGTEADATD